MRRFLVGLGAILLAVSARGASIDVGTHTLLPNTPNQTIDIVIRPGDRIETVMGLVFIAFIQPPDDLSQESVRLWATETGVGPPSPSDGPIFTGLATTGPDLIFRPDETIENPDADIRLPRCVYSSQSTEVGLSVAPDGILARLTLDTTGILAPEDHDLVYSLRLAMWDGSNLETVVVAAEEGGHVFNALTTDPDNVGDDDFPDMLTNGYLRIAAVGDDVSVPEPATWLGVTLGLAALVELGRRARRSHFGYESPEFHGSA